MLHALLIRHPHIDKILGGNKTWEIRGEKTNIRGIIALVASGSGTVIGVCELVDCAGPLTQEQFSKGASKPGMRKSEAQLVWYKKTYAWVLAKPKYLQTPVSYTHCSGAMIWVVLDRNIEGRVQDQLKHGHDPE